MTEQPTTYDLVQLAFARTKVHGLEASVMRHIEGLKRASEQLRIWQKTTRELALRCHRDPPQESDDPTDDLVAVISAANGELSGAEPMYPHEAEHYAAAVLAAGYRKLEGHR